MRILVLKMQSANWIFDWFMYRIIEAKTLTHTLIEFVLILYILITLILWLAGVNPRRRKGEAILGIALLIVFESLF